MLYFLFGSDTFRSQEKLKEIIDKYQNRFSGLNLIRLNFKKYDFNEFKNFTETVSMFKEKKLIIIEDIFSEPQALQEKLLNYLKTKNLNTNQDVFIIFLAKEVDSKNKLVQFLNKKAKLWCFNPLNNTQLKKWIGEYCKKHKILIHNLAIEKLIIYAGNDLWRIVNEIEKLKAYKQGEIITIEDVNLLVKPDVELNIFDLIDALGQKNKKRALKLLEDGFKKGIDENYLLNRFIYQFRNILKIKTFLKEFPHLKNSPELAARQLGLHPFVVKKTISQAKNFTLEELKKIYQKLFDIETSVKTSRINPKIALELFIIEL